MVRQWPKLVELDSGRFRDLWTELLDLEALGRIAGLTLSAVYVYVFMEWIFFVTKPSFMSSLHLSESLLVLSVSPGPVLLAIVAPLVFFWMMGGLLRCGFVLARFQIPSLFRTSWIAVSLLLPSGVLALAAFLMVDNFTLTVLGWGIRHVEAKGLLGYQALLVSIAVAVYYQIRQAEQAISRHGLGSVRSVRHAPHWFRSRCLGPSIWGLARPQTPH